MREPWEWRRGCWGVVFGLALSILLPGFWDSRHYLGVVVSEVARILVSSIGAGYIARKHGWTVGLVAAALNFGLAVFVVHLYVEQAGRYVLPGDKAAFALNRQAGWFILWSLGLSGVGGWVGQHLFSYLRQRSKVVERVADL